MTDETELIEAIAQSIASTSVRRATVTNHHMLMSPTEQLGRVMWRLDVFVRRNLGLRDGEEVYALAYPQAIRPTWLRRRHLCRFADVEPVPEQWSVTDIHNLVQRLEAFELYRLVRLLKDLMQQQAWRLASASHAGRA